MAVVQKVDLIAEKQSISMVTRRITSLNKLTSCQSRKNEELQSFVFRFQKLAACKTLPQWLRQGVLTVTAITSVVEQVR